MTNPYIKMSNEELISCFKSLQRTRLRSKAERKSYELQRLNRELQVHQIEMEMQNRELRETLQELEESRNRFVDLYDFAPMGYLTFDEKGHILELNLKASEMLSKERSSLIGRPFVSHLARKESTAFFNHLNKCKKAQMNATVELTLSVKGQGLVPVRLDTVLAFDLKLNTKVFRAIMTDLTDQRKAEEASLRANEELETRVLERTRELSKLNSELEREIQSKERAEGLFRNLLEAAPDSILTVDRWGRILLVNSEAERRFGYSREELLFQPVETLIPDEFREDHLAERNQYLSDPHPRIMGPGREIKGRRKDGTEFPVEIKLSPLETEKGSLAICIIRDLTERKKKEDEIRTLNKETDFRVIQRTSIIAGEKELLRKYLDVVEVIIIVIGLDQTVSMVNRKGCEILGYSEEEILGKNWFDCFLPERIKESVKSVFSKLIQGEIFPVEYYENPILTKDGEEKTILWHNAILKDEEGRIRATLGSGLDITGKIQWEKLASVGKFSANLVHEIGSPLGIISGRVELVLKKMAPKDPLRKNLEIIIRETGQINGIVKRLLSFSRMNPPQFRFVPLDALVKDVLDVFSPQFKRHGIALELDLPEHLTEVHIDPNQMQQVLFNTVLNAVQAMPRGGKLSIRLRQTLSRAERDDTIKDQYLKMEITDSGVGIKSDLLSRIFDPLFTTKEVGNGTGIGLAMCYRIIQSHGGWIGVKSRLGQGTTFSIFLPLKTSVDRAESLSQPD